MIDGDRVKSRDDWKDDLEICDLSYSHRTFRVCGATEVQRLLVAEGGAVREVYRVVHPPSPPQDDEG